MPSFNNTIHSNNISGQFYYRGVYNLPTENQRIFSVSVLNSFPMLRQISRFDKAAALHLWTFKTPIFTELKNPKM